MESTIIKLEHKLLTNISEKIVSELNSVDNITLLNGKTGICLFLYNYAQLMSSEKTQGLADSVLDEVWELVHQSDLSSYFHTGHSGIAWAFSELGRKAFLDIDETTNSYIEPIDFLVFRDQKTKNPVLIDLDSGLFTCGIYLLSRCDLSGLSLAENYHWRECAIYLIEDCERILYKNTAYNNIFLPEYSLKLLNSIFYFLIEVHRQKIYPHKTKILLEYLCLLAQELIKESDIQDIITFQCLSSEISNDLPLMELDVTDHYIDQLWRPNDNISEILSESGHYSLLYNNEQIFNKIYSSVIRSKLEYHNFLCNKITGNKQIPIQILLGLGHGLLNVVNIEK